jgi:cysteine-rich repeat protein
VNGAATTSTVDGTLTWTDAAAATVATRATGPFVQVINASPGGTPATTTLALPVGGTVTWSLAASEFGDAQLTSFIYANAAKQFAKTRLNPNLAWLDAQMDVFVNEPGTCNARSFGDDIHFFPADANCQNTGRMADVVYHEFGHSLHNQSIIPGVGAFDGALSEGMSDVLASLITGDHGMGRGLFFNDQPLRDLDPPGIEKRWPDDLHGEVHDDGEIIGGTMWDLRVALEAKLGAQAGYEKMLDIYYGALQRAADIPSTYAEALLADDNDGNIDNGVPDKCEIDRVFAIHGLADPRAGLGSDPPAREGFQISISPGGNAAACPGGPQVASAVVNWQRRGDSAVSTVTMAVNGARYEGAIPAQPEGTVVRYQVTLITTEGKTIAFPNNAADPFYEFYVGPVEVIQCFGFDQPGQYQGWNPGVAWEVGAPLGLGGDPKAPHTGGGVLGLDLNGDGAYPPSVETAIESPEIDLGGRTAVRLQYYRWLGVEDGAVEKARVVVNDKELWTNFASVLLPNSVLVDHIDKEWRFVDHDLSSVSASGKVKIRFELKSDADRQLGGWTLDDVCVVALTGAALTCGNGKVEGDETCDDGNRVDGDGCSANCVDESPDRGGAGCCGAGTRPAGALAMSALVLGLALRRRRRTAPRR